MAEERQPKPISWHQKSRWLLALIVFLLIASAALITGLALTGILLTAYMALPILLLVAAIFAIIKIAVDNRRPPVSSTITVQTPTKSEDVKLEGEAPTTANPDSVLKATATDIPEKSPSEKETYKPLFTSSTPQQSSGSAPTSTSATSSTSTTSSSSTTAEATFEAYKKAADTGDEMAKYRLAECYELGRGCTQSLQKAFDLYKYLNSSACSSDEAAMMAKHKLAKWYQTGFFVIKDLPKAIDLYAFVQKTYKNTESCYQIGRIYEEFAMSEPLSAVKSSLQAAYDWFRGSLNYTSDNATIEIIKKEMERVSQKIATFDQTGTLLHTPPLFTTTLQPENPPSTNSTPTTDDNTTIKPPGSSGQ